MSHGKESSNRSERIALAFTMKSFLARGVDGVAACTAFMLFLMASMVSMRALVWDSVYIVSWSTDKIRAVTVGYSSAVRGCRELSSE